MREGRQESGRLRNILIEAGEERVSRREETLKGDKI